MRYLISFALLLLVVAFVKDPPLPEALLNAKTAFVENVDATDENFEKLRKGLKKWGHFTLVEERSSADIVISMSADVFTMTDIERTSIVIGGHYPTTDGNVASMNTRDHVTSTDANGKRYTTDVVSGTREAGSRQAQNKLSSNQLLISYIRIYNARNNDVLYSDKTGEESSSPGVLVSNLKKRMKQK
jgi:hypothetical protein